MISLSAKESENSSEVVNFCFKLKTRRAEKNTKALNLKLQKSGGGKNYSFNQILGRK